MSFPFPPSPRTWSALDIITVPRLRSDAGNLAQLLTKRPLLLAAQLTTSQAVNGNTVTPVSQDTEYVDNWSGHVTPGTNYVAQFPGWYWAEGTVLYAAATSTTGWYGAGIRATQNGTTADLLGNIVTADAVDNPAPAACDLVQLNPENGTPDSVSLFAYQNAYTSPVFVLLATPGDYFKVQWAGMPDSAIHGTYNGPLGTVVTSPQAAALWPPGSGTLITNGGGIAAGATSMTVASNAGMVTGGTLGLDCYQGLPVSPMAESVTISSVAGTTIGISATSYPHGGTASDGIVAVPVSAAFMNQQVRDIVNFLAFPPMLRVSKSGQTIPAQAFPASTTITFTTANLDNFSGWNGSTTYTFPVAGTYDIYGQAAYSAAVNNYSAGISINGGTVQWGDSLRNQVGGNLATARVRKVIRVSANDTMTLHTNATNNAVALSNSSISYSTLLACWKGF